MFNVMKIEARRTFMVFFLKEIKPSAKTKINIGYISQLYFVIRIIFPKMDRIINEMKNKNADMK